MKNLPARVFEKVTLYETLEKNYGVPTIYNQELFSAITADKTHAACLEVDQGQALLFIEMLSYTYKEKPYEYRETYCLTASRGVFREI